MINSCYRFEKLEYEKGLYDDAIDATFIIHLENNSRYNNIMNGLEKYKPTKIIYILYNKGYKNCKKNPLKYSAVYLTTQSAVQCTTNKGKMAVNFLTLHLIEL